MKKTLKWIIPTVVLGILVHFWISTLPYWVYPYQQADRIFPDDTPAKNRAVVKYIEAHGALIAPTYASAVCTEFVIAAIEPFTPLSKTDKTKLRIITDQDLYTLVSTESPIIKGVQYALTDAHKGTEIIQPADVRPGDFVQFWNVYAGWPSGHCGVVADIAPGRSITLYSSHPLTGGYGRQVYAWPDNVYFVRLQ